VTDVKICGLTCLDDALAAFEAGADYLGFVLYDKSPRGIADAALRRIVDRLPGGARAIGVFVNHARETVATVAADCGLHAVQLHGDEDAGDFEGFETRLWRAVRCREGRFEPAPESWSAERYVVDAAVAGEYGGTGTAADWTAAARLAGRCPVMLAGGLTELNVADAVRAVAPLGVDTSSGVEREPGRKDARKVASFIRNAKAAAAQGGPGPFAVDRPGASA